MTDCTLSFLLILFSINVVLFVEATIRYRESSEYTEKEREREMRKRDALVSTELMILLLSNN